MRRIFRTLKEGFIGFFRHFSVSLSSIAVVTFTMLFLGIILLLTHNITDNTKHIEGNIEIWASVKKEAESQKDEIEKQLSALEGVKQVVRTTKEQDLERYIERHGESYAYLRGKENPLLDGFIIYVSEGQYIESVSKSVKSMKWVAQVVDGGQATSDLIDSLYYIRIGGSVFVVALTLLAIFLISNTIKLSIYSRSDEIEIMRIVGATNNFIRSPFLVEGILIGLFGSLIPIFTVIFGYDFLLKRLATSNLFGLFKLTPATPMVYDISLIILGTSLAVGLVGSFISVTKNLRWVR